MDELRGGFLEEAGECVARLEAGLASLRAGTTHHEDFADLHAAVHTIKGGCGFLGFSKLEAVATAGEELLRRLRDGEISSGAEVAAHLEELVRALRQILNSLETRGTEGEAYYSGLVAALRRF